MQDRVGHLLKHNFDEIKGSSELMPELLKIYSMLYLHGERAGMCEKCHLKYYNEIKETGMEKVKASKRTCIPNWNGNLYSTKGARHYNSETITDEDALLAVESGALAEDHFNSLPRATTPKDETELTVMEKTCVLSFVYDIEADKSKTAIINENKGSEVDGSIITQKRIGELIEIARELTPEDVESLKAEVEA
jgi:hypothetical protein